MSIPIRQPLQRVWVYPKDAAERDSLIRVLGQVLEYTNIREGAVIWKGKKVFECRGPTCMG